jgi:hypothetical protein
MKHFYSAIAAALVASSAWAVNAADNTPFRMGGKLATPDHKSVNIKKAKANKIAADDFSGDIVWEAPAGDTKIYSGASHSMSYIFSISEEDVKSMTSEITFTEDGKAYWKNPLSQAPFDSYIIGSVSGNKISFQFPQHVYEDATYADWGLLYEYYIAVFDNISYDEKLSYTVSDDQTLTLTIADDGTISQDGDKWIGLGDFDQWDQAYYFDGYADKNIVLTPFKDVKVQAPASVVFEDWALKEDYNDTNTWLVKVGFDGSDVYVKGLSQDDSEMTFKGVVNGDKITIANGQYVGEMYYRYNYTQAGVVKYAFSEAYNREVGYVTNSDGDFVFNYDAEKRAMTSPSEDSSLLFAEGIGGTSYSTVTVNPSIYDQGEIKDYTPQTPVITKAEDDWDYYGQIGLRFESVNMNVDGQLLPLENFGYEIYVDDELFTFKAGDPYTKLTEDMTEIPYSFSDDYDIQYLAGTDYHYVYFYFNTMKKLGVRMVYTNNGQKYYSKFATLSVDFDGVNDINVDKAVKDVQYFDLSGRRVDASTKGFIMKRTTFSDGTSSVTKVIR